MAYEGFRKMTEGGVSPALAAWIGKRKYGAKVYDQHAARGESLRGVKPKKVRKA